MPGNLESCLSANSLAVTFAIGEIVEVWRANQWIEWSQRTSRRFNRLTERVQEALDAVADESVT